MITTTILTLYLVGTVLGGETTITVRYPTMAVCQKERAAVMEHSGYRTVLFGAGFYRVASAECS